MKSLYNIEYRCQIIGQVLAKNEKDALKQAKKQWSEPKFGWDAFRFIKVVEK